MDKQSLIAVLNFLKKNNFKETETLLRKESGISADELPLDDAVNDSKPDVKRALLVCYSRDVVKIVLGRWL